MHFAIQIDADDFITVGGHELGEKRFRNVFACIRHHEVYATCEASNFRHHLCHGLRIRQVNGIRDGGAASPPDSFHFICDGIRIAVRDNDRQASFGEGISDRRTNARCGTSDKREAARGR